MKKIYVSTFYNKNYGSALQAFALQEKLKQLGCDAYILRQINLDNDRPALYLAIRSIKRFFEQFIPEKHYGLMRKISMYREKSVFEAKKRKIEEFCDNRIDFVDVDLREKDDQQFYERASFIVGSDQVWNVLNGKIPPIYTLEFINNHYCSKYSYAASVGTDCLSPNQVKMLENFLADYKTISFREKTTLACFENTPIVNRVRSDIDPTLLFDGEFWKKLISKRNWNNKYVYVYMLRPDKKLIDMARSIALEKGLKIVYSGLTSVHEKDIITVNDAGVDEFLGLIEGAEYVVTNSFHGTCFSTQFRKKFVSVKIDSTGARTENFLSCIGLNKKLIDDINQIDRIYEEINYPEVEKKLNDMREISNLYLKDIVNG